MEINRFENVKIEKKYRKKLYLCNKDLFALYRNSSLSNVIWFSSNDNFFFIVDKFFEDNNVGIESFFKIKEVFPNVLNIDDKSKLISKIKKPIVFGDEKIYFLPFNGVFDILKDNYLLNLSDFIDTSLSKEDRSIINASNKIKRLFSFYPYLKSVEVTYNKGSFNCEVKYDGSSFAHESSERLIKNLNNVLLNLSVEASEVLNFRQKHDFRQALLYTFNKENTLDGIEILLGEELISKLKLNRGIKKKIDDVPMAKMKI